MSDIVRVTEEEFDAEGNLVRRVITEYGVPLNPFKPVTNTQIRVGDVWPYSGQIYTATDPTKYQSYNGTYAADPGVDLEHLSDHV